MSMLTCWCGNNTFIPFSEGFHICSSCSTLVSKNDFSNSFFSLESAKNEEGIYGKEYWFMHQDDVNQPHITERARIDLPVRCMNWLTSILKYKVPGGKAVEMGAAHGGFVYLLTLAGFDACGLELSPSIIEYAQQTFGIKMQQGIIEDQHYSDESLEVIAAMDVVEHLHDPIKTFSTCANSLTKDGIFIFQTPVFHPHYIYKDLVRKNHDFLDALRHIDHTYIYSPQSIKKILKMTGFVDIRFEPSVFWPMDMLVVAGKSPLKSVSEEEVAESLMKSVNGRMLLALLDLEKKYQELHYISKINIKYKNWILRIKRFKNKLFPPASERA